MKQSYSFRLDGSLIKSLDAVEPNRTLGVTNAIQMYLNKTANVYNSNTESIRVLEDHVAFLTGQITHLQRMNSYLSLPWYRKLVTDVPLLESKK